MQQKQKEILVTSALPYANGPLHLGHIVEYIQTDIWVRFQKLMGHQCYFICADDAHGTPIMLHAEKLGIKPEELIANIFKEHRADFEDFLIDVDHYHTTHSKENQHLAEMIFSSLQQNGDIIIREIEQAFDEQKNMFLPDRFVKGQCPKCNAENQNGDNCEACGATYTPTDLINPVSILSGTRPIKKKSEHLFFDLPKYQSWLNTWLNEERIQPEILNKLKEWLDSDLMAWDISRDAPYFGFPIPGFADKYFYVWLDAPIGYMASFLHFDQSKFEHFWRSNNQTELYHFIGKDIVYFHALFWPAMLKSAGFRTPTAIFAHGFLTIDGEKMSKSRGTFIKARTYLKHLHPEYLRYYFAAKLSHRIDDIDLNFEDFQQRVNSDLIGKIVNIPSRLASFLQKHFHNQLAKKISEHPLLSQFIHANTSIAKCYEQRDFQRAVREITALADLANQYIDEQKPWIKIKDESTRSEVQTLCTIGLNLFRILIIYLKPILPQLVMHAEKFLNIKPQLWQNIDQHLIDHLIHDYQPLATRIEQEKINAMIDEEKANTPQSQTETMTIEPIKPNIGIDDFNKIDLRVARVIKAEAVEEADKLLKLQLDIGESKPRQVFAGIKAAFKPEELEGRLVVMVANLEPRKMRFGLSEGMVIVASDASGIHLVEPAKNAKPGDRVK